MAGRPGSTFSKLQKERARHEKQREKIERRRLRKLEKAAQKTEGQASDSEPLPASDNEAGAQ